MGICTWLLPYQQIGYDGNYHAQKADPNIAKSLTYTDTNYPACGAGCSGNMRRESGES
ncbi:MAG: hypothetical protein R2774_00170 [Saprospiraceae bacterium]